MVESFTVFKYFYGILKVPYQCIYTASFQDLVLDIPGEFRDVVKFRRTLGHKANHLFLLHNTQYRIVHHPVLGGIGCLIARIPVLPGDEVTANYNYKVEAAPDWYLEQYYRTYP